MATLHMSAQPGCSQALFLSVQFGVPLYGATLVGEVVHMSDNEKGCSRFSQNLVGKQNDLPVVALVHRGGAISLRPTACMHLQSDCGVIRMGC